MIVVTILFYCER